MKTKLLKKLRNKGRNQVHIHSVTTSGGCTVGMRYGYDDDKYSGLFHYGDCERDVKNDAMRIYMRDNIESIRKRYRKYRRKSKQPKC